MKIIKVIDETYFLNPKQYIPEGCYCYDGDYTCVFWDIDFSKDYQDNGYCHYMNECDSDSECTSLIWDMCKECGVKDN